MTENEYIIATNRVNITSAIRILKDVLAGDEWGVPKEEFNAQIQKLYEIEESLFSKTEIETEDQQIKGG